MTPSVVSMFWHGGKLPIYAWPCINSFIDHGHEVRLYAYEPLEVPPGVVTADARAVLPLSEVKTYPGFEAFADAFRYALLFREGGWWADVDVLCLTDQLPEAPYAWAEEEAGVINNAILKFPKGDPLMAQLATRARVLAQHPNPWGATGPHLLSEAVRSFQPSEKAGSMSAFYPLHWLDAPYLLLPKYRKAIRQRIKDAMFLHLWASTLKAVGMDLTVQPPPGSFMQELLAGYRFERPSTLRSRATLRGSIRRYYRQSWVADRWMAVFGQGAQQRSSLVASPDPTLRGWTRRMRKSVPLRLASARHTLRAKIHSASLPPGDLQNLDRRMNVDQHFVLKSTERWGPVFKCWWHGSYTTCVVGHARGRRLLDANEDRLVPKSIDLTSLFPIGWIRMMRGRVHQHYRRQMILALNATLIRPSREEFRHVIRDGLSVLSRDDQDVVTRDQLRTVLRAIASTIMLRVLFGVAPSSETFHELERQFRYFGPHAPPHDIDKRHREAFEHMRACVDRLRGDLADAPDGAPVSMLKFLVETKSDDETALGNLIFMFQPAHFDLYSLWHWILYYLAKNGAVAARIAGFRDETSVEAANLIRATIAETLRLNQSEVLYRRATDDIVFDGHFMPKSEVVRLCLWEGHKDETTFPEPFAFRPERFLEREFGLDQFAPFGMDKHRCIGADATMAVTSIFIDEVCKNFSCRLVADGPPMLGAFHWEPGADSLISLLPRSVSDF